MFANCSLGGMNFAFPDTCLFPTPSPAGPIPTPMPFPNIAQLPMALPPTCNMKHFTCNMPSHTLMTTIPISSGDEAGCMPGGVMSGIIIGPSRHMLGSVKVFSGGMPVTRSLIDITMQNLSNCPGIGRTVVPSQFKVIVSQ